MDDYRHNDKKYIKWAQVVKVKDGFICQVCGQKGGKLESHHKNSWDRASEEERYSLLNGVCLCFNCHQGVNGFHSKYGFGNNTEFQFNE